MQVKRLQAARKQDNVERVPVAMRGDVRWRDDAQVQLGAQRAQRVAQMAFVGPGRTWAHNFWQMEVGIPAKDKVRVWTHTAHMASGGGQDRPEILAHMGW